MTILTLQTANVQCQDAQELYSLKARIDSLVKTEGCSEHEDCQILGFGSKPCGGPWEYLIYSTEIDTAKLNDLVKAHNSKEGEYNEKYQIASDCSLAILPDSIKCENGCVAYYQGKAYSENRCCE